MRNPLALMEMKRTKLKRKLDERKEKGRDNRIENWKMKRVSNPNDIDMKMDTLHGHRQGVHKT